MKRAVAFLVGRVARSRLGVALVIAMIVLGVVGAARLVSGASDAGTGLTSRPERPITTVDPTAGDDGLTSTEQAVAPRTSPGAAPPEAVARAFATTWLRRDLPAAQWHAQLVPHSTPALAEKLAGVDPAGVPARQLTGDPVVTPQTAELAQVNLPMDTGTLRLQLIARNGGWLVDGVDWEQS